MRKFKDDLYVPLDEVHRAWIRKPVTIILSVLLLLILPLAAIIDCIGSWWNGFLLPCWRGSQKKDICEHSWSANLNSDLPFALKCDKCGIDG